MAGSQRLKIGTGPAHHRLMMIIAHRIIVGELAEIGRVAGSHIVKAHREATLIGPRGRIGTVLRAFARGFGDPDKEIAPPTVELLPHLKEAVHRVADRIGIADIFGDRERPVWQQLRKALVGDIARQTDRVGRSGSRQQAVGADDMRCHLV